jgi:hypothetical protein
MPTRGELQLATERARKRTLNELLWVVGVTVAVSAGIWTLITVFWWSSP